MRVAALVVCATLAAVSSARADSLGQLGIAEAHFNRGEWSDVVRVTQPLFDDETLARFLGDPIGEDVA